MTATGAESVEFEPVGGNGKAVLGRNFFLQAFDIAVFKFDNFAAAGADKMVVMALMRHVIVLGLCPKVSSLSQTRFAKQIEGPVNGCQSEMGIFAGQLMVHFLGRNVLLSQKGVEDQLPLASEFELVFPKVLFQHAHFSSMFRHSSQPILPGEALKTK